MTMHFLETLKFKSQVTSPETSGKENTNETQVTSPGTGVKENIKETRVISPYQKRKCKKMG